MDTRIAILGSALLAAALTAGAVALIQSQGPGGSPVPPPVTAPPAPPAPPPAPPQVDKAPPDATFAAPSPRACAAQAARYEGEAGFQVFVTRIGRLEIENPLRPLTPEVSEVLQVTIGSKVASAFGPNLNALRRGGPPGTIEAQAGTAIKWEEGLPALPDPLVILSDDGQPLARLGFRACVAPPPVQAPPPPVARKEPKPPRNPAKPRDQAAQKAEGEGVPAKPAAKPPAKPAPKTPPGFTLPQGAIAE